MNKSFARNAEINSEQSGRGWQLSLYEQNRTPQEVTETNAEIAVSARSLHSELICPICLDILKNTMTTKECLHRFCQECIITSLRNSNKECPTCRKKLISKRDLRPDPNFDELIDKIYPNRDEYEAHQERMLAKLSRKSLSTFEDSENSKCQSRTNGEGNETDADGTGSVSANGNNGSLVGSTNPEADGEIEIEIIFKPLDYALDKGDAGSMQTRYMKTTKNATIDHLAKYLSMRHLLETRASNPPPSEGGNLLQKATTEASLFTIYISAGPGEYKPLSGQTSLEQISDKFWRNNKPLELHYAYKMPNV